MSGNFLDVGVSGLLVNQAAINTTSHNIANANTEGYSRQVAQIDTRFPQFIGGNYVGTGAELDTITRIFDVSTALELQANISSSSELDVYLEQASRVNNLIADSSTGLTEGIQQFFSAIQTVADEPSSISARQVLVSQSQLLVGRFQTLSNQLTSQARSINIGIESTAEEITALGQTIADLNIKIAAATGGGLGNPNDLQDQRDRAINNLAELVDIQTIRLDDNTISVFVGSGQSLVVGATANQLISQAKTDDPRSLDLILDSGAGQVPVTETIQGGELGGLLRVNEQIIEPAFNVLGRVALAIQDTVNEQHQLGMDLNNEIGDLFFKDINDQQLMDARVVTDSTNVGTANFSVLIDDTSILNSSNYELRFQAGNYILTDITDNSTVLTFPPPGAVPATIPVASEGFSLILNSGAAVDGDNFAVFPSRNGAADISLEITNPNRIAAALPVNAISSPANTGSGEIAGVSVTDTSTPQFINIPSDLDPPLTFEFINATTFNVRDANTNAVISGPVAGFVPNQENDMLALAGLNFGYEITIAGAPAANDTFTASYNTNGFGDNRNMLLIGDLQQANTMDNNRSNYQQAFGRIVSEVGTRTQEARINSEAANSLLEQVKNRRESISGVNLDEEAAKLIKFEQAYQASAQIIQVARALFQTVIESTR
ncbi:flagellar hook-associated protein FlgK [Pleionea sediminis]|uniref:flagellar hook-associated protein FlgK n=1 Tax=Pleionea sediminis TaxID=2569479 RepID=UPI0011869209|nr:flagellar hook-associated protein FlgK [Pleionea sediminis]